MELGAGVRGGVLAALGEYAGHSREFVWGVRGHSRAFACMRWHTGQQWFSTFWPPEPIPEHVASRPILNSKKGFCRVGAARVRATAERLLGFYGNGPPGRRVANGWRVRNSAVGQFSLIFERGLGK